MPSYCFTVIFTAEGRNNERSVCRKGNGGWNYLRIKKSVKSADVPVCAFKPIFIHTLVLGGPYRRILPENVQCKDTPSTPHCVYIKCGKIIKKRRENSKARVSSSPC